MDYGGGQGSFLFHPMRVVGHQLIGRSGKIHEFQQFGSALGCGIAVQAIHPPYKIEQLCSGEPLKQRQPFRHDSNAAFHLHAVLLKVIAEDANLSTGRTQQACKHFDGGGLTGAVGAKKTKELLALYGKVKIIHGH